MAGRALILCALGFVLAACGSTTATPAGPTITPAPGVTTPSTTPGLPGGYGLKITLRSCATAASTPPPCDREELQNLLTVLKASPRDVVYVHLCWGNPPRNYEDIQARNVVVGPIAMPLSEALAVARSDRDVSSVTPVPLPFRNPECAFP